MNSKHPIYQIWKRIKRQCYNKNAKDYTGYIFYDGWSESFINFYNYVISDWKPELTIVCIDTSFGFVPGNICFKTKSEISGNNGRVSGLKRKGIKRSEETIKKIKATNLERYGVEYILQSNKIQQKIKNTCNKKYGIDKPSKLDSVKEKTRLSNIDKYGVAHPNKLAENRAKFQKSTIDNGQAYFFNGQTSDDLAKQIGISRSCMNRRIRKYGFEQAVSMDKRQSEIEYIISQYLNNINIKFERDKTIGKFRADFVIEDKKLIIEADGLYWHSDAINPNNKYHKEKLDYYESLGYRALFFRENEIHSSFEIVKSIINNQFNKCDKIYARKCNIRLINSEESKLFFENNHLMGKGAGTTFGLYYNNEIVCAMRILNKSSYLDISRFCNKLNINVIGGFSKILKYINNLYNKDIHTFIDRRYGKGLYLGDLGFQKVNENLSFVWIKNDKVHHRLQYRGNSGYKYGFHKLWDCGQAKYVKVNKLGV